MSSTTALSASKLLISSMEVYSVDLFSEAKYLSMMASL